MTLSCFFSVLRKPSRLSCTRRHVLFRPVTNWHSPPSQTAERRSETAPDIRIADSMRRLSGGTALARHDTATELHAPLRTLRGRTVACTGKTAPRPAGDERAIPRPRRSCAGDPSTLAHRCPAGGLRCRVGAASRSGARTTMRDTKLAESCLLERITRTVRPGPCRSAASISFSMCRRRSSSAACFRFWNVHIRFSSFSSTDRKSARKATRRALTASCAGSRDPLMTRQRRDHGARRCAPGNACSRDGRGRGAARAHRI